MFKIKSYSLFKFSFLLIFLESMFAWFLWGKYLLVFALIFPILATFLLSFSFNKFFQFTDTKIITFILLIIVQLYAVREFQISFLILSITRICILSIVLFSNDQIKRDLINYFTKGFAILVSISLLGWILFLLGVPLPNKPIYLSEDYYFDNYYFFITQISQIRQISFIDILPRFSSVFLEPGYLGMISTFLVIANRFDLKRKAVLIIFIGVVFSFSLAAYIVLIISFFFWLVINSKRPIQNILFLSMFLLLIYYFFIKFNAGENAFNNYIIKRLIYDNGQISGYNRFTIDLDSFYQHFLSTDKKYFGFGIVEFGKMTWSSGGNAGYKVYILQHGIVGALLIFLFYISMVWNIKSKLVWILLIAYFLFFLQASYPLMECELLIFITAIPLLKSIKK